MIFIYVLFAIIILSNIRLSRNGEYNSGYLSYDTTNAIKGVFILLVFISHIVPYITKGGYEYDAIGDSVFRRLNGFIGQWVVAMFLFYSGYGIMEAISKKGVTYLNDFPKKRILNVLLNFDIAVLLFIVTNILLGKYFSYDEYLLSLIGWTSVGNSNWYIFVILLCYLLVYITFRLLVFRSLLQKWIAFTFLSLVSIVILYFLKSSYWYDTMLCFSFGMLYSSYKEKIYEFISGHYVSVICVLSFTVFLMLKYGYIVGGFSYNIFSILFCLWILTITIKVDFSKNSFLKWCGTNLFPLYIYQRIPMIVLSTISEGIFVRDYPVVYIILCFAITLLITYSYKYWTIKI